MRRAAGRSARAADPQRGPSFERDVPGFYHFSLSWVLCEPGRIAALALSHYVNRNGPGRGRDHDDFKQEIAREEARVARLSDYMNRTDRGADEDLGAHTLCPRGLKAEGGADLARILDAAERKKNREYRTYGGRMPRVAAHLIASLRRGVTHEQSATMLSSFVSAVSDRLSIPAEGRVHLVDGVPDHIHVWFGTRVVESGRIGRKQRALDAVSEKADGRGLDVGGRVLGPTVEWMRGEWARLNREVTGDQSIDHRSYARRGLSIHPVAHVSRADIEYERRRGTSTWRTRRSAEIAARDIQSVDGLAREVATDAERRRTQEQAQAIDLAARQPPQVLATGHRGPPDPQDRAHAGSVLGDDRRNESPSGSRSELIESVSARAHGLASALGLLPASTRSEEADSAWAYLGVDPVAAKALIEAVTGPMAAAPSPPIKTGRQLSADPDERVVSLVENDTKDAGVGLPAATRASVGKETSIPHATDPLIMEAAVAVIVDLQARHRMSASRLAEIAVAVGLDADMLEAAALIRAGQAPSVKSDRSPASLPSLDDLQTRWANEDNRARRDRGKRVAEGRNPSPVSPEMAAMKGGKAPGRPRSIESQEGDHDATVLFRDRKSAVSDHDHLGAGLQKPLPQASANKAEPALKKEVAGGPHTRVLDDLDKPAVLFDESALVKAVTEAQVIDILRLSAEGAKPIRSDGDLLHRLALRLRAAGYDADEVAAALHHQTQDGAVLAAAVLSAFGANATTMLGLRRSFVQRARIVRSQTETKIYKEIRTAALAEVDADLKSVWLEGRMALAAARERHERWISILNRLRWRSRRLRRSGLMLAVLGLLIERVVLTTMVSSADAAHRAQRVRISEEVRANAQKIKTAKAKWRAAKFADSPEKPPKAHSFRAKSGRDDQFHGL